MHGTDAPICAAVQPECNMEKHLRKTCGAGSLRTITFSSCPFIVLIEPSRHVSNQAES
ncbi:hypothetical protein Poly41_52040 [Novipirellula artificiosorum]|uniref:Uncharacterized protein n=1 Tax=Novipirellula artificiosorum TaxID=2528016 RepID=A0A5C6DAR7_9BACT|nr:hypothetical protein Poly41_52040 [Novipirellula artificiosorum]